MGLDNLIYLVNIVLGLIGFSVALNICCKKRSQKPMICPLNMKCEQVLYSRYAKFLGIPLEFLGMLYYSLVIASYAIFLFFPFLKNPFFVSSVFLMSLGGFIFSLYLIFIQAFKLKEWCSWCLASAAISSTIFFLVLQTNSAFVGLTNLAYQYKTLIVSTYALASVLGLLAIFINEILLSRFLKDSKISSEESHILHILRQVTWLCLGLMIISNYALYLSGVEALVGMSRFWIKISILTVLVLINLVYDLLASSLENYYLRKLPFVLGPLAIISWLLIIAVDIVGSSW